MSWDKAGIMSSSKSSSSALHGIGGLPGAPIEHDTQHLFEAYWQRGKFDGKPLVLDASIYAQTPRGAETRFDGDYGGFEDAPDPTGTGTGKERGAASAPPSKDRSVSASTSNLASSGNEAAGGSEPPPSGLTKAQARRAQVRRAQIQHRQRKADYTKHLEMESAKFRDLVDQNHREVCALETENEKMRQMLIAKLGYLPPQALPLSSAAIEAVAGESDGAMVWEPSAGQAGQSSSSASERSNSAASIPMPVYSVSVAMSDTMGTPAMQVRRTSSPTQISPRSGSTSELQPPRSRTTSIATGAGLQPSVSEATFKPADIITSLSEEQTDHAINFILGLEHICWDHWDKSYFTHDTYEETGCMHGHALMASTIALQAAPVEVFNQLDAVGEYLRSNPLDQNDRSEHGRCDHEGAPSAHGQYDSRSTQQASGQRLSTSSASAGQSYSRSPEAAVTGSTSRNSVSQAGVVGNMARQDADSSQTARPGIPMLQDGNNISWPATGLSLETLHALASKLSPPETELAPVQAWFEILRGYGVAVVLDQPLMARMLAEFSGVVKCLHFGAVIERDAFDSVVSRVISGAQWS